MTIYMGILHAHMTIYGYNTASCCRHPNLPLKWNLTLTLNITAALNVRSWNLVGAALCPEMAILPMIQLLSASMLGLRCSYGSGLGLVLGLGLRIG